MPGLNPCSVVRLIGRRTTDQTYTWSADQRGPVRTSRTRGDGEEKPPRAGDYVLAPDLHQDAALKAVQREDGGWDVVLVLDGGYSAKEDAEHVASFLATQCRRVEL